jgi:hypothetical protein
MNRSLIIFISIWKLLFQFLKLKFTWFFTWIWKLLFESEIRYFNFDNYYLKKKLNLKIDIWDLKIIIWIWESIFQFYNCYLNLKKKVNSLKYIFYANFIIWHWKYIFQFRNLYWNSEKLFLNQNFDIWIS